MSGLFGDLYNTTRSKQINNGTRDIIGDGSSLNAQTLSGFQETHVGTATESSATSGFTQIVEFELTDVFFTALINQIMISNRKNSGDFADDPTSTVNYQIRYESVSGGTNIGFIGSMSGEDTIIVNYNPPLRLSSESSKISILMSTVAKNVSTAATATVTASISLNKIRGLKSAQLWALKD